MCGSARSALRLSHWLPPEGLRPREFSLLDKDCFQISPEIGNVAPSGTLILMYAVPKTLVTLVWFLFKPISIAWALSRSDWPLLWPGRLWNSCVWVVSVTCIESCILGRGQGRRNTQSRVCPLHGLRLAHFMRQARSAHCHGPWARKVPASQIVSGSCTRYRPPGAAARDF